jgi:hypothetical protein
MPWQHDLGLAELTGFRLKIASLRLGDRGNVSSPAGSLPSCTCHLLRFPTWVETRTMPLLMDGAR